MGPTKVDSGRFSVVYHPTQGPRGGTPANPPPRSPVRLRWCKLQMPSPAVLAHGALFGQRQTVAARPQSHETKIGLVSPGNHVVSRTPETQHTPYHGSRHRTLDGKTRRSHARFTSWVSTQV